MSNIAERELGREGHARPQLSNGVSAHSIRIRNGQLNWDALVDAKNVVVFGLPNLCPRVRRKRRF